MTNVTRKHSPGFFGRLLRSVISIVILSTLVLGISYSVKQLSTLDSKKLVDVSMSVASRLGIDDHQLGVVAGALVERTSTESSDTPNSVTPTPNSPEVKKLFTVALFADSHDDVNNLKKAISIIKTQPVDALFFLGDYTNWGDKDSLLKMKEIMDSAGITYYSIPGDHDLAASVSDGDTTGLTNYAQVFGVDYHVVTIKGTKFVMLDNSANYTPISAKQISWFESETNDANYVLLSQPLYHPTINLVMGVVKGQTVPDVRAQADELLSYIRSTKVKAIIAGDQHNFSKHVDPNKKDLEHIVIGALVGNDVELQNPQKPRFAFLDINEDGSYAIRDTPLE